MRQHRTENPGARAGATGASQNSEAPRFKTEFYRKRADAATALCWRIADCDPHDATALMEAAVVDLGAGQPIPPLISAMDEARTWVDWASISERKAYALVCFQSLSPKDQAAFLSYVQARRP